LPPLLTAFLVARRFLAIRAKMTAAACNDDAANGRFATRARLSFAVVDAVLLLIIAGQAIGIEKIRDGRTTERDGFAKDFLKFDIKQFDLSGLQAGADFRGVNLGAPQTFIGVNVSDAAEDGLIEKKCLDARRPAADQVHEGFARGFERVGTEAQEFLLKARAGEKSDAAESPGIHVAKFAAIVEKQDYVGVFRVRLGNRPRYERAGHSEMHEESRGFLGGGVSEAEEHEFSVAFDAFDGAGGKVEFDFSGIIDEVGFAQRDREDAPSGNFALQAAGYGFDFGKFGHGQFALR